MDTAGTEQVRPLHVSAHQLGLKVLLSQFMALHSMYMKSGDGFILVFSLCSMESVSELQNVRSSRLRSTPRHG